MKVTTKHFIPAIFLILIGVLIGLTLSLRTNWTERTTATETKPPLNPNFRFQKSRSHPISVTSRLGGLEDLFISIARRVKPSVVSINIAKTISMKELEEFHGKNKDFWEFFNKKFFKKKFPKNFRQDYAGSGIILSKEGYILTNTHVVEGADEIQVTLFDNRTVPAQIVGYDPLTEVAVIKISADSLRPAVLGNSDRVQVGQWVLAFGNPLELKFTVTAGIVSAIGRQMRIIEDNFGIENFIQTDAVINPGNSGGALVNLRGEVIGINTAIASKTGYYAGYGFAIPINLAKVVAKDLITTGKVVRAYLGIAMQPVDEIKARAYGLKRPVGVYVDDLLDDGPAGKAGIRSEDIILAIDQEKVNSPNHVQSFIALRRPGDVVHLRVFRNGKTLEIPVKLGQRQTTQMAAQSEKSPPKIKPSLGLTVKNLDGKARREYGISEKRGVVVDSVEPFSKAFYAHLRPGYLILAVNHQPVKTKHDFNAVLKKAHKGDVLILLVKGGDTQTHLFLEIP